MDVVLLFPGQGSQKPGMAKDLVTALPAARDAFSAVDEALGESLSALCFDGPAETLTLTHNAQPALLTHGGRDDIVPPVMSERFAAAARAAGDGVDLVVERDEGHFGHIDPANALWAAVTAWLATR